MNVHNHHSHQSTDFSTEKTSYPSKLLEFIPIEGVAFVIASLAVKVFNATLAPPLFAIGISVIVTRLVLKGIDCYDNTLLINATKEVCKFNRNYPKLQLITFIVTLAISFVSQALSIIIGTCLGGFGSMILDVENYKLLQKANRKEL